ERPQAVLTQEPAWTQIFRSETVTLRCQVPGHYTDWKFTWYKAGWNAPVTQDSYSSIDGDRYTISYATQYHSGEYTCKGKRRGNPSDTSDALALRVSDRYMMLEASSQSLSEGDRLSLKCHFNNYDKYSTASFYKNDKQLDSKPGRELVIDHVSKRDEGSYKCSATWRWPPKNRESDLVEIEVTELFWQVTLTAYPRATLTEGDPLSLICDAVFKDSRLPLQYSFMKDGSVIETSENHQYNIATSNMAQTGLYKCAIQMQGVTKESEELKIEIKSKRPLILTKSPTPFAEMQPQTCKEPPPCFTVACRHSFVYRSPALRQTNCLLLQPNISNFDSSVQSTCCHFSVTPVSLSGVALRVSPIGGVVIEGTSLSLLCSVAVGSLPIVFTWHREGSQGHIARHTAADQRSDELILLRAQESDTGSYCCQAAYGEGEEGISSQSALLTVLVPVSAPSLSLVSGNSVAPSGDTLTLRCESHRGTGPIWYSFHHRGNEGNQSSTLLYWTSLPGPGPVSHNRTILNESDSGQYWCDSFNNVSQEIKTSERINITAIVPVAGANLSSALPEGGVWKNSRVSLHCSVLRGTKPSYSWYRNGQRLHIPDHTRTYTLSEGGATLSIHSVQELHEGTYQCVAENQITERRTFNSTSNTVELRTATALTLIVSLVSVFILLPVISACLFLTVRALKNNQSLRETIEKYGVIRQKPKTLREPAASPVAENSHDIPETSHAAAEREGELVYAVVDIKKKSKVKRGQEPKNRKNPPLEYCVTYAKVNDRASEKTEGEKEECVYSLQHEAGIEGTREEGKGKREEGRGNEGAREGRTEGLIYTLPIITKTEGVREGGKGKSGREECFYSLPREVGRGREGCMYFEPRQTERGGGGEREEEVYSLPRGVGMYSLPREVERENGRGKGPGEGVYSNEESLYENFQQRT
ncbi:Fc receptor-like protein 5, partial [Huso huso]